VKIAYVLYPDFTALDLVGPYEVISRWPEADVHFVASALDPVRCDAGLTVIPTDTPETLRDPDLIVVPGSGNPVPVLSDEVLIEWLRTAAPNCQWTASVCTGAGLYAAAGLLEGKKTTTHWGFRDNLKAMGVEVVADRAGSPDKADASTLRLALRVPLGDRPFQRAARINRQSAAARVSRARRALADRRANRQTPTA
jgi:putative intracellular protease/amidase